MNNEVRIFNSLLTDSTYDKLISYIKELKKNKNTNFTTSTTFWDEAIIKSSVPVLMYQFTDNDKEIFNLIKSEIESKIDYYITNMKIHLWPNLSYIPWHNDGHYTAAMTLYLNENWNEDWGGYFMYKENNEIRAIKPKKNLAVLQPGGTPHCVSTININAELRISLQLFLTKEKNIL